MGLGMEKKGISSGVSLLLGLVIMCRQVQESVGAVYKVGDSAGWTIIGNVDYKQWAATKTFHVGDIILFVYNSQFHNVMQVKHGEYKSCNASAPIATHTTGNDSITITSHGHHFFLCGVPGHCQAGQKVDINVLRLSSSSTAPSPSSTSSLPPAASVVPPAPSPSGAVSLYLSTYNFLAKICLVVAGIVILV